MKNRKAPAHRFGRRLTMAPLAGLLIGIAGLLTPASVGAAGLAQPPALSYTVAENGSLFVPPSAMLAGQPSNVYVQTTDLTEFPPEWGKVSGGAAGITYVPQAGYTGPDGFSYTVCQPNSDAAPTCLSAIVTVTVAATATPTAQPSVVGTPGATSTGGVGAATGKPRATPPATSGVPTDPGMDSSAGWLVLIGLGTILAGALLLAPSGQRRSRRRTR